MSIRDEGADRFTGSMGGQYWDGRYADVEDDHWYWRQLGDGTPAGPTEDHVWFVSDHAQYGDYGGSLVQKTNYDVLSEKAEELAEEMKDRSWFKTLSGGHGSTGIAFHVDETPDDIVEMLYSLEDYPLLDEEKLSELEMEAQDEAWSNWAESDYRSALAERFDGDADNVKDEDLEEHFRESMETANEYWVNESGEGMYIDMKKIAAAADQPPLGFEFEDEGSVGKPGEDEFREAAVIQDAGNRGYSASYMGKHIGYFTEWDDAHHALESRVDPSYLPDLYFVNDHGNVQLQSWEGETLSEWV